MKKIVWTATAAAALMATLLSGCQKSNASSSVSADSLVEEGKVFNIYCWNEEFKGYCETYYFGTKPLYDPDNSVANSGRETGDEVYYEAAKGVPEGMTINWIINPSSDGIYQDKLDQALLSQAKAKPDQKVDLFLAEADYILKYVDSDYTADVTKMGVTDFSNASLNASYLG